MSSVIKVPTRELQVGDIFVPSYWEIVEIDDSNITQWKFVLRDLDEPKTKTNPLRLDMNIVWDVERKQSNEQSS